ncbi:hypothetical protein GOP47_0007932 [Adiantum capillus-veneris]|uniref:EF-hand domain-containing protein n=1 Tax=Adiantum capillus-veneris TaxID=13818 RepID=A0A9D4V2K5_ADICA|nr:hypothetical protein GOP47_0007932 [Adiantum capillus-veneris]
MKLPLPNFLRKKVRSSTISTSRSSTSLSQKGSAHFKKCAAYLPSSTSSDSNAIPAGFSSACTSLSSSCKVSSSEDSWSKGLIQAQQVSSMEEIVVLQEATGKVESQCVPKATSFDLHRELEETFMRFDTNHDGKISTSELGAVLQSLGDNPSDDELVLMVKEVDRDGDGFIDLQEFILLNAAASATGKEDLRDAFLVFDTDADGKISVEELHNVLSRLGEACTMEECGRMIKGVDTDGDGFVDFQEFCTMMSIQHSKNH